MTIEFHTVKFKSNPNDIIREAKSLSLTEDQWVDAIASGLSKPSLNDISVRIIKPERMITPYGVVRWIGVVVGFWCRIDTMVQTIEERIPPAIQINGIERRDSSHEWGYMLSFEIKSDIIKGCVKL